MKKIILGIILLLGISISVDAGTISSNAQVVIKSNINTVVSNVMNTRASTNKRPLLEGFGFSGYYKNESEKTNTSYNLSVGLIWRLWGNKVLTKVGVNNDNGYDVFSVLLKFDWNYFGDGFYPYVLVGNSMYMGTNKTSNRTLVGLGYGIKLFPNSKRFHLGISSGVNLTIENATDVLDGKTSIFWWRSRAKLLFKISSIIDFKADAVYSRPIGEKQVWRYYSGSLVFKVRDNISLIVSVKDYDYRVLNLGSGLNKTLSVGISL